MFFFVKELKGANLSQNHRRSQEGGTGVRASSIEMPPMTKIWQKNLVSSLSVSFSIFAYNSTRVHQQLTINNIDDQGARRTPLIQFFPTNLNVQPGWNEDFLSWVATSSPHLNFFERNAITSAVFALRLSARAERSDSRTVFGHYLYLAGRCCKKVPGAPRNVNPARE